MVIIPRAGSSEVVSSEAEEVYRRQNLDCQPAINLPKKSNASDRNGEP